jgi:hypothetical protein
MNAPTNVIDVRQAKERRRFYLERARRKRPIGSGSDLRFLMGLPRRGIDVNPSDFFDDIPFLVVGGVATRAFAPERHTEDVDVLVAPEHYDEARRRLQSAGFEKSGELFFPSTGLGLQGEAWSRQRDELDIITSAQDWVAGAFLGRVEDQTGLRVIPLPYLVLMKLDSARGIDQGDLTRMLGRLEPAEIEEVIAILERHSSDSSLRDDVRQYAELGRWEWQNQQFRKSSSDHS